MRALRLVTRQWAGRILLPVLLGSVWPRLYHVSAAEVVWAPYSPELHAEHGYERDYYTGYVGSDPPPQVIEVSPAFATFTVPDPIVTLTTN